MAFGKKYFSSYKSNNNLDYYLEIFLEDYTGSALELVMGAGGPVIEYETDQEDRFSPIISSSCKIPYLVKNYLDSLFIDDLRNNYQERQVYVHIYRSTQSGSSGVAPLWSGFLIMDIGSGVDKYFPYEEHLKFVDGLSLLKDIDFVDLGVTGGSPPFEERVQGNYAQENMYFGPGTYIYWIKEILAKSGSALTNQGASQNYGFTTSVNWYNGEMNATGQSSDPLHKTKCAVSMFHRKDDQGVFYPDNCYNVLKELLRHWGARITYWKHEFWIVQIPEYITSESGTISTPVNNNSRLYSNTGAYQGSQNHLGSTYYTRYEQTIENDKISKLSGTKYDYLPLIKQVNADFLSFSSKSYFGGFPFGSTATTQEVFQGTINSPSAADFLYLSIPLNWTWDLSNAPNFPSGHTNGWWCAIKFNFYASDGTTTYYLQYDSGSGNYFWVDSALWTPLGNRAPKYIISSKLADVTGHIGFEQQIPFEDENGNAISMSGAWSFFLDIEDYGTGNSNPGSFYINFSGYGSPQRMRNPGTAIQLPAGSGIMSGTVSWSNTLVDQQGQVTISTINNPAGFNAGTVNPDIRFATTSPFTGLLQTLNNAQSASNGETFNVINSNTQAKQNSEQYNFGTLLWGDSLEFAPSSLQVFNGSTYVNTEPSGEWGRGILTGTKTFTKMLIDEFFSGQTKIIISPSMRLAVGVANKNEDQSGTLRPRYVNPIGKLRETRDGTDPEYFFRRGSFYTLLDEWDYEGYEIIRNVPTTTTQSNGMGSMGGSQSGSPAPSGMSPSPMVQALSQNSPLAYIRATIPATGSNVAVNGNFNTAVGWSLGSGWSIDTTAKKAKFAATGSTSELTQSVLTQGLTYQVNFKVEVTAGTLLVKAGTSGTSQSITSSGDYSIYLDCEGSSLIKFQAGTTFTGNITYITLRDQKSLSSVPIEAIGTAVFRTGDTFNLINSNDDAILPLTVTSNQGSGDTTISVSSTPLYEDIDNGSYLLINQDDLSEQYQNKTKGTVAGFDITATGIAKSSINITDWLNSDTMSGAAVTNVPTALSVKNYVDAQVGSADTLQEVTDNGNTTTNSVMIGSSSSPNKTLHVYSATVNEAIKIESGDSGAFAVFADNNTTGNNLIGATGNNLSFWTSSAEKMRLTSTGRLGVNTSTPQTFLDVNLGGATNQYASFGGTISAGEYTGIHFGYLETGNSLYRKSMIVFERTDLTESNAQGKIHILNGPQGSSSSATISDAKLTIGESGNVGINQVSPTEKLHVVGDALITGDSHADAFKPAATGEPIKFKNFGSIEVARISDGGVLEIGNTSNTLAAITKLYVADSSGAGLEVMPQSAQSRVTLLSYKRSSSAYQTLDFEALDFHFNISGSEKMRLTSGGDLGIGISSPVSKINIATTKTVALDTTAKFLTLGLTIDDLNAGNTAGGGGGIAFRSKNTNSGTQMVFGAIDAIKEFATVSEFRGSLRFFTNQNSTGVPLERMRINSAGAIAFNGAANYGSSGQVLKSNGNASPTWVDASSVIGGPYLPLAGGTLTGDLILGSTSSPVDLYLFGDTTGVSLTWSNADDELQFSDNAKAVFGDSGDLQIYHDSNHSYISQGGTGKLFIQQNNNDQDLVFQCDDGSGGTTAYLTLSGSQTTINVYKNLLIGTTVDSGEQLQVNGTAKVSGALNVKTDKVQIDQDGTYGGGYGTVGFGGKANGSNRIFGNTGTGDGLFLASATGRGIFFRVNGGSTDNVTFNSDGTATFSGNVTTANLTSTTGNIYGSTNLFVNALNGYVNFRSNNDNIYYDGGYHIFRDSDASPEYMRLTSSGNLLIGTTTDSGFKLKVEGNSTQLGTSGYYGNTFIKNTTNSGVILGGNVTNNGVGFIAGINSLAFLTFGTSWEERMRLTSDGKLGIGTTSPTYKLDVNGDIRVANGAILVPQAYGINFGQSGYDILMPSSTRIAIKTAGTEKLSVLNNGNVLIGTTTDSGEKLQVDGNARVVTGGNTFLNIHHGNVGFIAFKDNSISAPNEFKIQHNYSQNNDFRISRNTGGTDFVIDNSGNTTLGGSLTGTTATFSGQVTSSTHFKLQSGGKLYSNASNVTLQSASGSYLSFNISTSEKARITANGLLIGTTTDSGVYRLDISGKARVQSVFELDDVLTLNQISTPADPASGQSSIYMDSADGAIKVKINVGGTVVTRTIASFE